MEKLLEDVLGATGAQSLGSSEGGFINEVHTYQTDKGKFFVKSNKLSRARQMFAGEYASLEALRATGIFRCPQPLAIADGPGSSEVTIVMEHLDMKKLEGPQLATLGEQIARLHLHNGQLRTRAEKDKNRLGSETVLDEDDEGAGRSLQYTAQFGFPVTTWCGFIAMDNSWSDDWVTFFTRQRLQIQIDLVEKEYGDKEVRELWPLVVRNIPKIFAGVEITPSLLHGDLYEGNIGQVDSNPVIFDPYCFYGHSELDLSMGLVFGGFSSDFYDAYHSIIPRAPGFQDRFEVYNLFNQLNHWNHFGPEKYKQPTIEAMHKVAKL